MRKQVGGCDSADLPDTMRPTCRTRMQGLLKTVPSSNAAAASKLPILANLSCYVAQQPHAN